MFDLTASFSSVVLNAVADPVAVLLLSAADGDAALARGEAIAMLADYRPATREELRLAAQVVSAGLKALSELRESERPDTPDAARRERVKSASTLLRNEASCQRKLDALQRARRKAEQVEAAQPQPAAATQPSHGAAAQATIPPNQARIEAALMLLENMSRHGISALFEAAAACEPGLADVMPNGDPDTEQDWLAAAEEAMAGAAATIAPSPAAAA